MQKEEGGSDYLGKEMRRTILKLVILNRMRKGKVYSYALVKEIKGSHLKKLMGKNLKSDIYNTITALEKLGLIRLSPKVEHGRVRNYYTITASGKKVLASALRIRAIFMNQAGRLFKET